jgi:hypothetical protein
LIIAASPPSPMAGRRRPVRPATARRATNRPSAPSPPVGGSNWTNPAIARRPASGNTETRFAASVESMVFGGPASFTRDRAEEQKSQLQRARSAQGSMAVLQGLNTMQAAAFLSRGNGKPGTGSKRRPASSRPSSRPASARAFSAAPSRAPTTPADLFIPTPENDSRTAALQRDAQEREQRLSQQVSVSESPRPHALRRLAYPWAHPPPSDSSATA